jgi:hypothetical protein
MGRPYFNSSLRRGRPTEWSWASESTVAAALKRAEATKEIGHAHAAEYEPLTASFLDPIWSGGKGIEAHLIDPGCPELMTRFRWAVV